MLTTNEQTYQKLLTFQGAEAAGGVSWDKVFDDENKLFEKYK